VSEVYKFVGARIRSARVRAGLTQAELAARIGLKRTSVTNIEQGNQTLAVHTLLDVAEACACQASTLLPTEEELLAQPLREWVNSVKETARS